MQVDAFMIARAAEVHDGLVSALGAGWTRCWPGPEQKYPYLWSPTLFASLRVASDEMNKEHSFSLTVRDPGGTILGPSQIEGAFIVVRDPKAAPEMSQLVHITGSFRVELPKPGIHSVVLGVNGADFHRIAIEALPGPPES